MAKTECGFLDRDGVKARDLLVRLGPTLKVDMGFDPDYDGNNPRRLPRFGEREVWALIDTGATECCIDGELAERLNLPVVDERVCLGIAGPMTVNMHLAQIHVPNLQFTYYGAFAGVNLAEGDSRHLVLIGRAFLQHFTMAYDGTTGSVSLEDPI
jgi:predicted aspartyl protease